MLVSSTIDFCLRYYDNVQAAVTQARLDPCIQKSGGGGHSYVSDPTANKAIRNVEELPCVVVFYGAALGGRRECMTLHHPERWLRVIDYARSQFAGQVQWELIRYKYREGLSRDEILQRVNVGRTLYHVMLNDVFCFAMGVATGLGLNPKIKK